MHKQFADIKNAHPGMIILFRLGDFYEAFDEDAVTLSRVIGITLTGRGKDENRRPMAGIPYHSLPNYIPKIVEAGLKVAIADQMEDPLPGKLVDRKVTKIITPGTLIDDNTLIFNKSNFIISIYSIKDKNYIFYFLSKVELTTGEFKVFQTQNKNEFLNEIKKISPSEILYFENDSELLENLQFLKTLIDKRADYKFGLLSLFNHYKIKSLKGFGLDSEQIGEINNKGIVIVAGTIFEYLKKCQPELNHLNKIELYSNEKFMQLDGETIKNLEVFLTSNGKSIENSLFQKINNCSTSFGQRKLREWLIYPSIDKEVIENRLNNVEIFFQNRQLTLKVIEAMKEINDIERIAGKIGIGSINPKEIIALSYSLKSILKLNSLIKSYSFNLDSFLNQINFILDFIDTNIDDNAPIAIGLGSVIREGVDKEIDRLRSLRSNSKEVLLKIQTREVERTGINSLKISFNSVFGYYFEITRSNLNKVPSDYIRKQTLANAERYITDELKVLESEILSAEEKLIKLENQKYNEVKDQLKIQIDSILMIAKRVAEIDIYSCFGLNAFENNYVKPTLSDVNTLRIIKGRHPVIESIVEEFTPNSVDFSKSYIHLITGPNMSGKSTFIRQIAVIALLAHIGSFVPADEMQFSIIDRIFTRVGAGDNLSKGESTFMVEMSETANILNNATRNSLIILDEVGRGTSTFDGVAIAWSIIEYIRDKISSKTLFATHYHELISLEDNQNKVKNFNVQVIENNGEILFTHKIIEGGANKSYGIYVAEIAGIPKEVVSRSKKILINFEKGKDEDKLRTPKKISSEQLHLMN